MTHSFLLGMGGLAFSTYDETGTQFIGERDWVMITTKGAHFIMAADKKVPHNQRVLNIPKKQVEDKSKANQFVKFVVIAQTLWFIAQCVARVIQGLGLTPIELNTAMHVVCAIIMNCLWWHKPFDVQTPLIISGVRASRMAALLYEISVRGIQETVDQLSPKLEVSLSSPPVTPGMLTQNGPNGPSIPERRPREDTWSLASTDPFQQPLARKPSKQNRLLYLRDSDYVVKNRTVPRPSDLRQLAREEAGNQSRGRGNRARISVIPEESGNSPPPRYTSPSRPRSSDSDRIVIIQSPRDSSGRNHSIMSAHSTTTLVESEKPVTDNDRWAPSPNTSLYYYPDSDSTQTTTSDAKEPQEPLECPSKCPYFTERRVQLATDALEKDKLNRRLEILPILAQDLEEVEDYEGAVEKREVKDLELFRYLAATYHEPQERLDLFYNPIFSLFTIVYGSAHLIIIYCQTTAILRSDLEVFLWKFSAGLITATTGALFTFDKAIPWVARKLHISQLIIKMGKFVVWLVKKSAEYTRRILPMRVPGFQWFLKKFPRLGKRAESVANFFSGYLYKDHCLPFFRRAEGSLDDPTAVTGLLKTSIVLVLMGAFALCRFYLIFECLYTIPNLPERFYQRPTIDGFPFL
ncbi:hypothetical protein BJ508DRAFT_117441 [Ascobolus immersus RN42]|uniref:Uncharacterized protein n=1 Tax=Ascobolus immersus RN42 TaxID=1160509 RepID=A0A3N4I4F6_ASCIM|nr:hypothetical protein BJ508DRAFT_117441 [Ascobolus immersus RN42]